ncbi:MAG: hypothetical protein AAGA66_07965 [Bacteroidota bacterium]
MNTSKGIGSCFDPIDRMIFEGGLRIQKLFFDVEMDLMLIVLNNKKVLQESISKFKLLRGATKEQLERTRALLGGARYFFRYWFNDQCDGNVLSSVPRTEKWYKVIESRY